MKKIIALMSLTIVFAFYLSACKKKDKQPQTTIEKIQGKWNLENETDNVHTGGQDNITNSPGGISDVVDFRTDGKVYSDVFGTKDTSGYILSGDTKIVLDGTEIFDIKTLTSNSFIIYNKEIFSSDEYDEVTISLKR